MASALRRAAVLALLGSVQPSLLPATPTHAALGTAQDGDDSEVESESCHYTQWSRWSNCQRIDCTGRGFQQRSRSVFDSDTSPCLKFNFPSVFQKQRCRTRPCCFDAETQRVVELGGQRRVSVGAGAAVIRCEALGSGFGARFQYVACVDPAGRRSDAEGIWLNAEGFFEQCRIRKPCFYPNPDCLYSATIACEDDKGNKVPNGTEWMDSTGKFYKRCELHSISYEEADKTVVKSYVNDVSCVNEWGRKVGNWTEWLTKNRKYYKRCEIDWWDWRYYSAAAAIKVISCADDLGGKVANATDWVDAQGRRHFCNVELGQTGVKGEAAELRDLEPPPVPPPTPPPPPPLPNITFVQVIDVPLSPFYVWTRPQPPPPTSYFGRRRAEPRYEYFTPMRRRQEPQWIWT